MFPYDREAPRSIKSQRVKSKIQEGKEQVLKLLKNLGYPQINYPAQSNILKFYMILCSERYTGYSINEMYDLISRSEEGHIL